MPKIINLKQGSPEWKAYRRWKVCASDISTIMGLNPWKTPRELYDEKMEGKEPFVTDAMRRGVELEPVARQEINEITGMGYIPICMEHDVHDFLFASLDGWCPDSQFPIAEIKAPGEKTHRIAVDDKVPAYYECQVQTQMFIADVQKAYYVSYMPEDLIPLAIVEVDRDLNFCARMLEEGKEFYRRMVEFDPPPKTGKEAPVVINDPELLLMANQRYQMKLECDKLQAKIDEIDEMLKARCTDSSLIGNLKLTRSEREGSIDYKKVPEPMQLELEKYRKPKYLTWTIRQLTS